MAPSALKLMHTAAVLKGLQQRYTAARVFVVGISIEAEESMLDVAAPLNPTYEPCVPFGIKTVPPPNLSQPCRWIRICGVYFLALSTVVDTLSRLTKLEVLEIGEEPGDLARVALEESPPPVAKRTVRVEHGVDVIPCSIHPKGSAFCPACIFGDESQNWAPRPVAKAAAPAVCGCGASTCPHGHCAESCEGFPCGECGNTRSADK